jgi:hypothetical protein
MQYSFPDSGLPNCPDALPPNEQTIPFSVIANVSSPPQAIIAAICSFNAIHLYTFTKKK